VISELEMWGRQHCKNVCSNNCQICTCCDWHNLGDWGDT